VSTFDPAEMAETHAEGEHVRGLVDEVAALNEAAGERRFFLRAPSHALGHFEVMDGLGGLGYVAATRFHLADAVAERDRLNTEAAQRETYRAIRGRPSLRWAEPERHGWPEEFGPYVVLGLAAVALVMVGLAVVHQVTGWWP
jgi:hypothetical protein